MSMRDHIIKWANEREPVSINEIAEHVQILFDQQARVARSGMDAAKAVSGGNLEQAKCLHAECNPDALESERQAIAEARASKPAASLYLLPNARGLCHVNAKGLTQTWDGKWYDTMRKALKQTDLKTSFTQHDLRAKVGSDAENDSRAQELLGHTSVAVTRQHYRRKSKAIRPVK